MFLPFSLNVLLFLSVFVSNSFAYAVSVCVCVCVVKLGQGHKVIKQTSEFWQPI